MGSNETATATTGGPRVIDVFAGNGAPSGPNYLLFSDVDRLADTLWDRSEVRWSLCRMRRRLGLSRELWIEIFGKSWSRAIERKEPWKQTISNRPMVRCCARGATGPRAARACSPAPARAIGRAVRKKRDAYWCAGSTRRVVLSAILGNSGTYSGQMVSS